MADWSGQEYRRISDLQRSIAGASLADLTLDGAEWVLDIGCGDGFLTRRIAARVPAGFVVGIDPSPGMVAAAIEQEHGRSYPTGPQFLRADARHLPFRTTFDVAVSFNALHWVPQIEQALGELNAALRPGGRALVQLVCAGDRLSIESTAMQVAHSEHWVPEFVDFAPPFIHLPAADFAQVSAGCGLHVDTLQVSDHEWDFGSREAFSAWCAVGCVAWTDRLPAASRRQFVADLVTAYERTTLQPGLFHFRQMRAELRA